MITTTHTNVFTNAPTTLSPIEQLAKIEADMNEARTQEEQDSLWEQYRALYEEVYEDRIPDPIYTTRCSNEQAWLQENGEEKNDELQGSLFLERDGTYLTTLHDRIRYHTACALSSFTHKVIQENPDAPYLNQAPSDDPVMIEFIDAIEETIRLECALGFMDPWQDTINPWN